MVDFSLTSKLRAHQVAPAKHLVQLLRAGVNCVDLSDCGVGKTAHACYAMAELNLPALAIVPKISKTSWSRMASVFGDTISTVGYEELRTGRSPYGRWENTPPPGFKRESWWKCFHCQREVNLENPVPCYTNAAGIHCVEEKKVPWKYGKFYFDPAIKFLIFDEMHRCSAPDSLNHDMMVAAKRQGILTLGLSATLAMTPMHMKAPGFLFGLHNHTDYWSFLRRHGCGKIAGMPGIHWLAGKDRQKDFMSMLNSELIPKRGIRITTAEIPNFPKNVITAELYDLDDAEGKIEKLYAEMAEAVAALKERETFDACSEHPLTKQLRTRQLIELLKVPLMVELAQDSMEKGFSVGLFINFSQTMAELRKRLKTDCVIDGDPKQQKFRQKNIDEFLTNNSRLILVNNEAGGVSLSLQDLTGEHPRLGYVSLPQSARTFRQLVGRFPRDGGKSTCYYKVLLAARTIETKIHAKLENALANLEALNDSHLTAWD